MRIFEQRRYSYENLYRLDFQELDYLNWSVKDNFVWKKSVERHDLTNRTSYFHSIVRSWAAIMACKQRLESARVACFIQVNP